MGIREARTQDAAAIADIRVSGWQVAYRGLVADEFLDSMSVQVDTDRWTSLLNQQVGRRRTLVAVEEDDVVAFCSLGPYRSVNLDADVDVVADADVGTIGEIYAFYVHPAAWGHGRGDALMTASIATLTQDGWSSALLWVLEDNPRARHFYERHAWLPDGLRHVLPIPGEPTEVRLHRVLD